MAPNQQERMGQVTMTSPPSTLRTWSSSSAGNTLKEKIKPTQYSKEAHCTGIPIQTASSPLTGILEARCYGTPQLGDTELVPGLLSPHLPDSFTAYCRVKQILCNRKGLLITRRCSPTLFHLAACIHRFPRIRAYQTLTIRRQASFKPLRFQSFMQLPAPNFPLPDLAAANP